MDSLPSTPPPNRTKAIRTWIIIAAICLVVAIVTIISSNKPKPGSNFVWLDQSQFAYPPPGRLKRLYYKVVNLTAPVWQHFRPPKKHICITSELLAVHGLTTGRLEIGSSMATNETGAQVWLLSPSQLDNVQQRLKTAHGIERIDAPSLTTVDGQSGFIFAGHAHRQTLASIGFALHLSPKIVTHKIQLAVYAVDTEECDSPPTGVRTNLSAACRVTLSNAGGVLISSPLSKDLNGTNYWLILSPTAVDGHDKPIKM